MWGDGDILNRFKCLLWVNNASTSTSGSFYAAFNIFYIYIYIFFFLCIHNIYIYICEPCRKEKTHILILFRQLTKPGTQAVVNQYHHVDDWGVSQKSVDQERLAGWVCHAISGWICWVTLRSNIAMKNPPFIEDLQIKTPFMEDFQFPCFDCQRVTKNGWIH